MAKKQTVNPTATEEKTETVADEVNETIATTETASLVVTDTKPIVLIKTLPHYEGLPELFRADSGSAGIDLYAANHDPLWLGTIGDRQLVPTGVIFQIPDGFEGQVRPRSGLAAKHGLTVLNTPGTIDSTYRGEILVCLVNTSTVKFKIERGMRIAQLIIAPVIYPEFVYTDSVSSTSRGSGGYGSTGVK